MSGIDPGAAFSSSNPNKPKPFLEARVVELEAEVERLERMWQLQEDRALAAERGKAEAGDLAMAEVEKLRVKVKVAEAAGYRNLMARAERAEADRDRLDHDNALLIGYLRRIADFTQEHGDWTKFSAGRAAAKVHQVARSGLEGSAE